MKPRQYWHWQILGLIGLLFFSACRKDSSSLARLVGPPQVGATYLLNDGEGGFRAAKVLAVEEEVVFVGLFGARWSSPPSLAELHQASGSSGVAYSHQTFTGMQPLQLETGSVSTAELAPYESWKTSNRDVF